MGPVPPAAGESAAREPRAWMRRGGCAAQCLRLGARDAGCRRHRLGSNTGGTDYSLTGEMLPLSASVSRTRQSVSRPETASPSLECPAAGPGRPPHPAGPRDRGRLLGPRGCCVPPGNSAQTVGAGFDPWSNWSNWSNWSTGADPRRARAGGTARCM